MKSRQGIILTIISAVLVTACSNVPLSTMWKMSKLNPLTMNPRSINIAVITHEAVQLKKNAVQLQMTYKTAAISTSVDDSFPVQVSNDIESLNEKDKAMLTKYQGANETIHIFSLSESTANEMRRLQQKVRTLKKNNVKGSGSISVSVKELCLTQANLKTVSMDILARFNAKDGYVVLTQDIDILKQLSNSKGGAEALKNLYCTAGAQPDLRRRSG